jgi:hypothetical protein
MKLRRFSTLASGKGQRRSTAFTEREEVRLDAGPVDEGRAQHREAQAGDRAQRVLRARLGCRVRIVRRDRRALA